MKKFVSMILAIAVSLSMFSLNAFSFSEEIRNQMAEVPDLKEVITQSVESDDETADDETGEDESVEDEPAEEVPEEEPVPEVKEETRLDKWLVKMLGRNEWSIFVEGKYGPEVEMFLKDGNLAILVYSNGAVIEKVLYDGDKAVACYPQFPYYYYELDVDVEASVAEMSDLALQDLEGMEFIKSYETSELYVEEYEHPEYGFVIVYFDGDDIVRVEYPEREEVSTFSYEVKDKDVKLPFYALNLTPLINYLISFYSFFLNVYMGILFDIIL